MAKKAARRRLSKKIIDDTIFLQRPRRGAKLPEKVWQKADGEATKYNLAYINNLVCRVDNGRVLVFGYRHDNHYRHFMGNVQPVRFTDYQSLSKRFQEEVRAHWRQEDEQNA